VAYVSILSFAQNGGKVRHRHRCQCSRYVLADKRREVTDASIGGHAGNGDNGIFFGCSGKRILLFAD